MISGTATSGRPIRKAGLRKFKSRLLQASAPPLKIISQGVAHRFVGRERMIITPAFPADLFQAGEKCLHVRQIILPDEARIEIEMAAIDLETFETRPASELEGQLLNRHGMQQDDLVPPRAQKPECLAK